MNAPDRIWAYNELRNGYTFTAYGHQPHFGPVEYVRADLFAALEAEKAKAEAERDRAELDAAQADGKIRNALPTRFVLVPPDGGNVETLEAVQETVKALDRAEGLLKEAAERARDALTHALYLLPQDANQRASMDAALDGLTAILARAAELEKAR